ncbi:hypothetical protein COCSUDRAFT_55144 [Coccomyxa subellipsoidea C-169]|uniref:Fe2OG dioxygenase domain-containing protein n=1 Tax=Coccomyxa subellipsoidea (strain C-169) TaxID=574566 RepID=I0Z901_COCSC|nr:hypothetical protein COCSUDRAFT_55144 [Coccomyxa subellipsoidea C-169]EIE27120.1 hypothetical protein COCSUDRAFT_55144 [Coccomyxa subellipsoidea C-169]|eukprot:XP_005651664.1 hypothetical protein COCSUDRAFT_55144 [Coccomyxa subellipsoidea C-169]
MAAHATQNKERIKAVLLEVFGASDDEEDDVKQHAIIEGSHHCPNVVSDAMQEAVMKGIAAEGWFDDDGMNQAMCFGSLPVWATKLASTLPAHLFSKQIQGRTPVFDQLTANAYESGDGICAHVDLDRFEDGIAIVSLGSSAVMDFTRGSCHERLLLRPGDVLLLEGEARYKWKHGIASVASEQYGGQHIQRGRRISVTFRKLVPEN